MKVDPKEVRDSLVRDVVEPAKANGQEVSAPDVEQEIVGILNRLERKQSDRKPVQTAKTDTTAEEFKRRTGDELNEGWRTTRKKVDAHHLIPNTDRLRAVGMERLRERLQWIKQRPDLFAQVKGMAVALNSSKPEVRERAGQQLRAFIEKTNRLAGHDWRKPKPKKLHF